MSPGEAHCDQELADEVRRGPLRSRADRGGPLRPAAIKSWQWRSGEAHCDQELAEDVRRGSKTAGEGGEAGEGRRRASDIKSNKRHLVGGEKTKSYYPGLFWE